MAGRRPHALVVDFLLAIVVAVLTLAMLDSGSTIQEAPVAHLEWNVEPPPRDMRPGDVWNAQIVVFRNGATAAVPGNARPLLTVQNVTTGEWTTKAAQPTETPGFYRARVVFRDRGEYSYSVLIGDGSGAVPVGKAASAPPADPSEPVPVPGGLIVLALLSTLPIALRRRAPIPVLAVTLTAAIAAELAYENLAVPGPLVALYTVGAHVPRPASLAAAAATAGALPLRGVVAGAAAPRRALGNGP